jgi:hypothetical protein
MISPFFGCTTLTAIGPSGFLAAKPPSGLHPLVASIITTDPIRVLKLIFMKKFYSGAIAAA